jgi:hypothetical protein
MQIADEMEQEFESHHLLFEVSCRVRKLGSELTGPPKAMTIKMPHIVKPGDDKRAADFIAGAALRAIPTTEPAAAQDNEAGKAVVNMRFDTQLLARVDAAPAAGDQPHGMAACRSIQGA